MPLKKYNSSLKSVSLNTHSKSLKKKKKVGWMCDSDLISYISRYSYTPYTIPYQYYWSVYEKE